MRHFGQKPAEDSGMKTERVALYARVSTFAGQNPELQLTELREYASRREWHVVGIPVKVNVIPEGRRTAFRSEGEQQSERSDAGTVIVE